MRLSIILRRGMVTLSLLGMLTGPLAQAAVPSAPGESVRDVALSPTRVLAGQVVDAQGVAVAGADVRLVKDGQPIAAGRTDAQGRFELADVKAGVYELQTATASTVCRAWAAQTAPPSAGQAILLVAGQDLVRQQNPLGFLANPWVLGAIVAAAIAIPLALDDDDDPAS